MVGVGFRGTRLYFVLLVWTSASNSLRKLESSCSAASSRESCFAGGAGFEFDGGGCVNSRDGV